MGFAIFYPCLGLSSYSKINSQNRHEMGHQSSGCAQKFQRTKKLTTDSLRFANNVHLTQRFNHGLNSRGSPSRLAKSRFEKNLHACIVASHVVCRARDACCPVANLI